MKALKPAVTLAGAMAALALSGVALAAGYDDSWPPPVSVSQRYVVVPEQPAIAGYVVAPRYSRVVPAPATRYYYYEPAPTYYYYEPARVVLSPPAVAYYYDDDSPFPRSNAQD